MTFRIVKNFLALVGVLAIAACVAPDPDQPSKQKEEPHTGKHRWRDL